MKAIKNVQAFLYNIDYGPFFWILEFIESQRVKMLSIRLSACNYAYYGKNTNCRSKRLRYEFTLQVYTII